MVEGFYLFIIYVFFYRSTVWHRALKDIPTLDGKVKGMKMEAFIFDAFAVSKKFGLLKVS